MMPPKRKKAPQKNKTQKTPSSKANPAANGIKKEYLKTRKTCKVTFRLPRIAAPDASSVHIVGEFNDWSLYANPMKKLKNGDFKITLELDPGRDYQFRYLVDGEKWENDWNADSYVKSPFGDSDNSIVSI
jgi:1,4-alpha-glucan branching enzyme